MPAKCAKCKKGPVVAVAKKCWNILYARWSPRIMPEGTAFIMEDRRDGSELGRVLWCSSNARHALDRDVSITSGYSWLVTPMRPL